MSYGVMAFAVDLGGLRGVIGSGDAELARRFEASCTAEDREVQEFIDDETDQPGEVTVADVARHMIMGEPYDERLGFAYSYFLEHLCEKLGTFLDNSYLMPVSGASYIEQIDKAFASAGLLAPGFSVSDLVFGGSPVPLPLIDDWPRIGYREYGDLEEPAERLSYAASADLSEQDQGAAYTVFQWLSNAHTSRRSVVAFYH